VQTGLLIGRYDEEREEGKEWKVSREADDF
jgi:hypothetical protein